MVIVALVVLFLMQLLSILVIIILNSKIAKFKDLEIRQDHIVREMDDTIGVYLLEMREENDRLIQELRKATVAPSQAVQSSLVAEPVVNVSEVNKQTVETLLTEARTVVPKTVAANVYNKYKVHQMAEQESAAIQPVQQKQLPSFEQAVLADYKLGMSIEEIAKKTQRGKTEIELLIKFHA